MNRLMHRTPLRHAHGATAAYGDPVARTDVPLSDDEELDPSDAATINDIDHSRPRISTTLAPNDQLSTVGLRATGPRLSVLEFFNRSHVHHASVDDIFRGLREQGKDIALGTIYRVVSHLTDVGLLSRSIFEAGIAVYELSPDHAHDHLVCLECGRIEEFVDPVIDERRRVVAREHGFAAAYRQLAFYGYCPTCRLANGKPKGRARS